MRFHYAFPRKAEMNLKQTIQSVGKDTERREISYIVREMKNLSTMKRHQLLIYAAK